MTPQDEVRALSVALAVLRGNAGGYSEAEKKAAIQTLDEMFQAACKRACE